MNDTPIHGAGVFSLVLRELGIDPPTAEPATVEGEWYPWRESPTFEDSQRIYPRDISPDLVTWVEGTRKLIVSSGGKVEAYDVLQDPEESTPLELSQPETERALERARAWWRAHEDDVRQTEAYDEEELEELRRLGYIGEDA